MSAQRVRLARYQFGLSSWAKGLCIAQSNTEVLRFAQDDKFLVGCGKSISSAAVSPQRLKPHSKQCSSRSGKPLRHPKSSATPSAAIDECGYVAGAEAVIDVYYADVGGAGVHHSEESRQAFEGCAITYAGRNGNHRDSDQAADYAG